MSFVQVSDVISFFVSLAVFTKIISMVHNQCVDETRSDLFNLRDRMFLYAVDNNLLDTDAYRQLRYLMNDFIRYAHRLSAMRVLMIYIASMKIRPPTSKFSSTWNRSLLALSNHDREEMQSFLQKHKLIIVTHIIHRSLLLRSIVYLCAIAMKLTHKGWRMSEDVVMDYAPWKAMEAEAASA
jgi:hypothetical protein